MENQRTSSHTNFVIETSKLILNLNISEITFVDFTPTNAMFKGIKNGFSVDNKDNELYELLINAGFMHIQKNRLVNPASIVEFNFRLQQIKLTDGMLVSVYEEYTADLANFLNSMNIILLTNK